MDTALAQNLHGSRPGALWQRNSDCWAPHAACVALANARPLRENKSKYVRLWWQRSSLQGTRPLRTPRAFLVGPHAHDSVSWFYCSQHGTDTSCMHHYSPWLSLDERQSIIRIGFPDDETFGYHSRPCRSLRRSPSGAMHRQGFWPGWSHRSWRLCRYEVGCGCSCSWIMAITMPVCRHCRCWNCGRIAVRSSCSYTLFLGHGISL